MLRQIQPSRKLASIVKWEGIVIDPIGAVLAVLVFEFVFAEGGDATAASIVLLLAKTAAIGMPILQKITQTSTPVANERATFVPM